MEVMACPQDGVALSTLECGFREPASQSSVGAGEVALEESRGQMRVTLHPCLQQAQENSAAGEIFRASLSSSQRQLCALSLNGQLGERRMHEE